MGWMLNSIRADTLTGPDEDGDWLPPLHDNPQPRVPLADYLPAELQDLQRHSIKPGAVQSADRSGRGTPA
jgi:hypothetical protein